jgi:predicted RNase H-like HicB family nuclease
VAQQTSTMQLTASVVQEGEWFVARCVEVEVVSQGQSVDEALRNLTEALELYFEDESVPPIATSPIVASVEVRLPSTP